MSRKIVVGFSGGVTSAWCAGWALRNFPRDEVVLLFHDTKAEDQDTYRFLDEMEIALGVKRTDRSDGRSLDEVFEDEGMMASSRAGFCTRILKQEQGDRFIAELKTQGATEIIRTFGYSAHEEKRIQNATALGWKMGFAARFPLIEEDITKQQAAEWCSCTMGVPIPRMYAWSEHANCVGCVKGGKAYWLAVKENAPEVFAHRKAQEKQFGHQMFSGYVSLEDLERTGLKRKVNRKESIEIGPCECGS